jgi:4-hydroxybenzoate polyprenyltransferase
MSGPFLLDIARELRAFANERYPVVVALPVAICLSLGPYALGDGGGGWIAFARAVTTTYLILFTLRIVDDINSVDEDRITNPARVLPSRRVTTASLVAGAVVLSVAAFALSLDRSGLILGALVLYYTGYFHWSRHIPVVLRPWLVNVVFLVIPLQTGLVQGDLLRPALWMLGVFFWLSAVGHDFAHSVHAEGELHAAIQSASRVLGPRNAAIVALTCYAAAFAVGMSLAFGVPAHQPSTSAFLLGMTALSVWVGILLIRLIAVPCAARAKPLYVSGFGFLLVPSPLLWLERVLGS